MARITAIILTMVGMVIGVNLISPVNTAVSVMVTPTYSAAVVSLSALLPLMLIVAVLIGAVRGS